MGPAVRRAALVAAGAYAVGVLHAALHEQLVDGARLAADARLLGQQLAGRKEAVELSAEQVARFSHDGFLVARGLLPRESVELLFAHRPRSLFPLALRPVDWLFRWLSASQVSIDAIWSESELFRTLWYAGPVAKASSQLMGGLPVRLLTDICYGVASSGARPVALGKWHKDSTSFDVVERGAALGLSAWIPLVDIDAVRNGGSIMLGNISTVSAQCQAEGDDRCSPPCMSHLDQVAVVDSWRRGDVLFFTDHTFHRSQPFHANASVSGDRFSLVGRFVHADAVFKASASLEQQRKNFCNHLLKPGDKIHSDCFPQLHPLRPADLESLQVPSQGGHILRSIKEGLALLFWSA
jgi:hypothetical protein